jgi:hypothetical protein
VLTLEGGGDVVVLGGTDTETVLVERDLDVSYTFLLQRLGKVKESYTYKAHPLLVEHVATGGHVGSDVTADGVTDGLGTVGVELTSSVAVGLYCQYNYGCVRT